MLIRQGDLILIPTARPVDLPTTPPAPVELAQGEDSGHAHVLDGLRVGDVIVLDEPAQLRVEPPAQAWRHTPIVVPAGAYSWRVQREYTPAGSRQVQD